MTTTIKYNPEDLYTKRCHVGNLKSEVVQGVTKNDVTVTKGYLPSGSPKFSERSSEYTNESYEMLKEADKRPKVGWSESEWNNWKEKFQNGSLETNSVNLSDVIDGLNIKDI